MFQIKDHLSYNSAELQKQKKCTTVLSSIIIFIGNNQYWLIFSSSVL